MPPRVVARHTQKQLKSSAVVKQTQKDGLDHLSTRGTSTVSEMSVDAEVGSILEIAVTLDDGNKTTLKQLMRANNAKVLVVVVYTKANTPGCTRQVKAFTDAKDALVGAGCCVLGASLSDSAEMQKKFAQNLNFHLAVKAKDLLKALNCLDADEGKAVRSVVALNTGGEIIYERHKVKADECCSAFIDFVQSYAEKEEKTMSKETRKRPGRSKVSGETEPNNKAAGSGVVEGLPELECGPSKAEEGGAQSHDKGDEDMGGEAEEIVLVAEDSGAKAPKKPKGKPKASEKSSGKAAEPPSGKAAEPPNGKTAEPPRGKAAEQSSSKAAEQSSSKAAEQSSSKTAEQSSSKTAEQQTGKTAEQQTGKAAEQQTGKAAEQQSSKAIGKSKATGKSSGKKTGVDTSPSGKATRTKRPLAGEKASEENTSLEGTQPKLKKSRVKSAPEKNTKRALRKDQ